MGRDSWLCGLSDPGPTSGDSRSLEMVGDGRLQRFVAGCGVSLGLGDSALGSDSVVSGWWHTRRSGGIFRSLALMGRLCLDRLVVDVFGTFDLRTLPFLFKSVLHRTLTWLSVRPGTSSAILAQHPLRASKLCISSASSSADQRPCLRSGSRNLHHRSLHCLVVRPVTIAATHFQLFTPKRSIAARRAASSDDVQVPLTRPGRSDLRHRWLHCV